MNDAEGNGMNKGRGERSREKDRTRTCRGRVGREIVHNGALAVAPGRASHDRRPF